MARKYTKKSDYWKDTKKVEKAVTPSASIVQESLNMSREIGTVGLNAITSLTKFLTPYELRFPECIRTYKEMGDDPDVATALDATYTFVDRAFFNFRVDYNRSSKKSKKAADFIDYCFRNMDAPLRQYVRSLMSYKQFGFAIAEKVIVEDLDPNSPYFGYYRLKKLASRPQETLDAALPFTYTDDGREIISVNQNITSAMLGVTGTTLPTGRRSIPINKVVIVGNNITENNPLGESPLRAVHRPWREKSLIQEYEVVGVAKDLGGTPVLQVPSSVLTRASLDPTGEDAESIRVLQNQLSNLNAGEATHIILPSDVYPSTSMNLYKVEFQGVSGSGKQFDTGALIAQRKKEIYDRFGAGVLIMGSGDDGSFSLSDNKQTLLSHYIERDVDTILEALQGIIPQLLRLNGFVLAPADIPVLKSEDIGDPDIDIVSSSIQRIVGVKGIPMTPEVINEFLSMLGMKYRIPYEIASDPEKFEEFVEEFMSDPTSRSGDGVATVGTGTSTKVGGIDTSVANVEN